MVTSGAEVYNLAGQPARIGGVMDEFVARQNVMHFRQLLAQETDATQRVRLERLMAEAEAALARTVRAKGAPHDSDPSA